MLDVLIRGALIVDGSGGEPYPGDVGVVGERIEAVGPLDGARARREIDGNGHIVVPGFIDPHSHTDLTLLGNPLQQSTIRQGVTTEIVGNCGLGCCPVSALSREATVERLRMYGYAGEVSWSSFGEFWQEVERIGTAANFASFVPHNAVRATAGVSGGSPTPQQVDEMTALVEDAMDSGALGVSTGLEFEPGRLAAPAELVALMGPVKRHGGIYASHVRNRDAAIAEAADEFFQLAVAAGERGQFSHLNVRHNTGAAEGAWAETVARLEDKHRAGMDVYADATPMRTGDGTMAAILPPWLTKDGPAAAAKALRDPGIRARAREDCDRYWRFIHRGEWHRVRLLSSPEYPELCGLTFPEIAERLHQDEWDCYFDILAAAGENLEGLALIGELFTEEMSQGHIRHPLFLLGADTMSTTVDEPLASQTRHPLNYSAHAHYLVHHVREAKTLPLQEAVRKMTSYVADRFGLAARGRLAAGCFADLAVIDFEHLDEVSTLAQPIAYARGVEQVFVNGAPVIADGEHTGATPGRFLTAG